MEARIVCFEQGGLRDLEIPPVLSASVERHGQNLVKLMRTLQAVGMTDAQIEANVAVIVASYRDELTHAIQSMAR